MSGIKLLADTNAIVHHLNGNIAINSVFEDSTIFISSITFTELLANKSLTEEEITILRAYLSNINIIHTNDSICEIAAEIRKNNKVKLPDAIIAATSLFLSIPLVTFDKGFRSINKLRIITPLV